MPAARPPGVRQLPATCFRPGNRRMAIDGRPARARARRRRRVVYPDPRDLCGAAGAMLAGATVLPALPGHPGLACPLRALTGIPCPLCGMTTSVESTVRLDLATAAAANPAGIPLVVAAVALLVGRPSRIPVPAALIPLGLAAMWVFELHCFGLLP